GKQESSDNLPEVMGLDDLVYVIYTSGSTGVPKGVCICQRSLLNYTHYMRRHLGVVQGWHLATVSSLAADLGHTAIFPSLLAGGCLHILPYEVLTSGERMAAYARQYPLDVLKIVPSHLRALLASCPPEKQVFLVPGRWLVLGGEALSWSLLAQIQKLGGSCQILNHYGPTETTVGVLIKDLGQLSELVIDERIRNGGPTVPIGRPIANVRAYILDPEEQLVPPGVIGELAIGGVSVAVGYLHQDAQTEERFRRHKQSIEKAERLYWTGDLVRCTPEGDIVFVRRKDNQIKLRGYRIELEEIESILVQHEGVWEAAVRVWEEGGEGRLLAYIVARRSSEPTSEELAAFVARRLPSYMVPATFINVSALPLTANGKINRLALPAPQSQQESIKSEEIESHTPIEEMLVRIWQQLLKVERVGLHESFASLGGHSLLATQVVSRIRTALQVEVPLRSLFETPTIAELAQVVEGILRGEYGREVQPIVRVSREQELPLSFAQQRLWFFNQLKSGSTAYHLPVAVRLDGILDVDAFERSLSELVRRHEILRTTFPEQEGAPLQVIHPANGFPLPHLDLSEWPDQKSEVEIQRLAEAEAERPFDLERGPLLRGWLLRLGPQEHVLLLTMHHIVSDGWSNAVIVGELTTLYGAYHAGRPSPLPELPIQYADFAAWQRQWLRDEVLEAHLRYWKEQLGEVIPLDLLTDYPRPPIQSFHGAQQTIMLPHMLSEELKQIGQQENVTLFMLLLAAFQVLLARYSGQQEIFVGTLIANRNRAEIEDLIGFFVNTLVLHTSLSGDPSFRDLLGRVRETALGAYAHQDLPFEKLVEVLQPERDLSRSPLFQVMFILQNLPQTAQELPGVQVRPLEGEEAGIGAKFDLCMMVTETPQGLRCSVQYNTDLFEASTIERLLEHWQTLLHALPGGRSQPISGLPLLPEAERRLLVETWNQTQQPEAAGDLASLFEQQVEQRPDAIALQADEEQLSYSWLNQRANRLAQRLRQLGVRPEEVVGVCLPRGEDLVPSLLAILKAGGAYLALDPSAPAERLALMLADACVRWVLSDAPGRAHLPDSTVRVLEVGQQAAMLGEEAEENPLREVQAERLAYVSYTSGSTGQPKGVAVTQRGVARLIRGQWFARLDAQQHWLQLAPASFDASTLELWGSLLNGGRLLLFPAGPLDLEMIGQQVQRWQVSTLHLTAGLFHQMVEQQMEALRGVGQVLTGGDVLSVRHVQQAREALAGTRLVACYGPTENTTFTSCQQIEPGSQMGQSVPIGRPIGNTTVYLLDEQQELVPVGVEGEVYTGGAGLARGYVGQAGETAERFVPHPYAQQAGERLYRTGDRARWRADGTLEFLGRVDSQVKIRGFRVEPAEIEAVL
ncbi:MAG TPA: amino acid adenylation domain-containing protein, partial [Ktedonobacteraceae bacterium]|nr:amino acid adenylation domain-containing protein [Ktedonobacteraceae bacterium]